MNKPSTGWKKTGLQFVLFNMIGLLNTAIDFAVFTVLITLSVHVGIAQAVGYMAGMINSYVLNSRITFREHANKKKKGQAGSRRIRFLLWNLTMLLLSVALMTLAVNVLHIHTIVAKIGVTIIVLAINFYGNKRWVFSGKSVVDGKEAVS